MSLALAILVLPAHAQPVTALSPAGDVMALVRADRWADAAQAVAGEADPVAGKLVTYLRLLAPAAANASEIDAFMTADPDWPNQAGLARRREEALAVEPDDATARALCARLRPRGAGALSRCADAAAASGQTDEAAADARAAWIAGFTERTLEAAFTERWGGVLTAQDQWLRFIRLATALPAAGPGDIARQMPRLDAPHRQAAAALLALRRDDAEADALYAALPADLRGDPAVMLDAARHLRRQGQDAAAMQLWTSAGATAQQAAPDRLAAFLAERCTLARLLLRDGDAAGAYAVASGYEGQAAAGEALLEAEFLAGWIALRRLHDAGAASVHFARLTAASPASITQGRAHYWLARAAVARGDAATARAEYATAARWPTTYYGQLAALAEGGDAGALTARIAALRDPGWSPEQALDFAGREVARAAALLVAWGDPPRARPFLLRLVELAPDPADQALAARFASGLGMPEQAVMIARRAGLAGQVLAQSGWPIPYDPPRSVNGTDVAPAITLGLIRQESSFDPQATSSSGARGLMQLMPATARTVARQAGGGGTAALAGTPADNMRLGVYYLGSLLGQFDDALPLAVAAYNAGPSRVAQWLSENGDPRAAEGPDMIDWIELIPFNETRNYVQRVIENVVIYRARLGDGAPHPLAKWLG